MNRQQRRAINRSNAQLSTGPVTEAGKLIASRNATTHGLTSLKPYLPAEEADYRSFSQEILRRFDPQSETEHHLAATLTDLEWRLKRIPSLEARLFADPDVDPYRIVRALDVLSRHELRLRRLLKATQTELADSLETRRKRPQTQGLPVAKRPNGFVLQNDNPPSLEEHFAQTEAFLEAIENGQLPATRTAGA